VFDGEDEIDGMTVYRFVQTIEPTVVSQLEVPGSLAGSAAPSIEADRTYANTRTLWIEPETGVIIRGQEEQDTVLVYRGEEVATITSGTIRYTDEQVQANVDEYRPLASQLNLVGNVLPLVLGILGVVGLIAGIVLLRSGYRPRRAADGTRRSEASETADTVVDEKPSILDFDAEPRSP
jgi:hypothetical protein